MERISLGTGAAASLGAMPGQQPARQVLDAVTTAAREVLGERLAAVYALGSLAHGGFAPLVSDVDVALVLTAIDHTTADGIARVNQLARTRCATDLAERLSLFWTDADGVRLGRGEYGRLAEVDRLDLIDAGLLLAGTDQRTGAVRPDSADLVRESAELAVTKFDDRYLRTLTAPATLVARGARAVTKAVLFPVRFLFTLRTGQIGHNADAATWYTAHGAHGALVEHALRWRGDGIADPDRAVALLEQHLIGVYDEFLDTFIRDLPKAGVDAPELIENLRVRRRALQSLAGATPAT
jgi:predicted nucleotidyltransferase